MPETVLNTLHAANNAKYVIILLPALIQSGDSQAT